MITLAGDLELSRSLYKCMGPGCNHRWRPLDECLKLPTGRYSESVRRVVSLIGGNLPFERASDLLWETAGIKVSASQICSITEQVGADIGTLIEDEVAQYCAGTAKTQPPPEVFVLGADGAHLNTREGSWKETKVGSIRRYRRINGTTLELQGSSFTAHLGGVDEFRLKLDAEIARNGFRGKEATIFLGDGAPWIWNMAEEIAPDAIHVLDYYHLCEHVWDAGKILFEEQSTKLEPWVKQVTEDFLRLGHIQEAIDAIRTTQAEVLPSDAEVKKVKEDLIRYIENNEKRMNYAWLESKGYPIGSGHVESACKQIVCQRHKQAGMRWSKAGAQKMLNLAAFYHGSRWDEYWRSKAA